MKFVKVKSIVKGIYIILFLFQFYSMSGQHIQPMKYLALGDSYTIGERVPEADRWYKNHPMLNTSSVECAAHSYYKIEVGKIYCKSLSR